MKNLMIVVLGIAVCLFSYAGQAGAIDLTYAGSVTVLESVMKEAAPIFEKKTGLKIGLSGGGSGAGVKAVVAGTVELGGVSRDLKKEEIGQGVVAYKIAYGAVGLVMNKSIAVDNLTSSQVKDILTGKIRNWKEVSGQDQPIRVVISTPGCACREEFQEIMMSKEPYAEGAIISPMKTLSETVQNTPGAVGPLATAVIDTNKVKTIRIDGLLPTSENVKNKKYLASREVNLVTKGQATGNAKKFIDFILSPEGQSIIEKNLVRVR